MEVYGTISASEGWGCSMLVDVVRGPEDKGFYMLSVGAPFQISIPDTFEGQGVHAQ